MHGLPASGGGPSPGAMLGASRGWESRAGEGPVLRGRRVDGSGPTIHFLPGNGFCGGVYWPFLKRFAPDRSLFLHDIEGHGASDAPAHFSGIGPIARNSCGCAAASRSVSAAP